MLAYAILPKQVFSVFCVESESMHQNSYLL